MGEHPAVVFLRKTHERAERAAQALPPGPWGWHGHDGPEGRHMALEGPSGVFAIRSVGREGGYSGIERHPAFDTLLPDPEHLLLRVREERALLEDHQLKRRSRPSFALNPADLLTCPSCWGSQWPCDVWVRLAKAWGWDGVE